MDFSAVLPTFLITLREGVEAALVVGIVLACLQKSQRIHLKRWVYGGIGLGLGASVLIALAFRGLIQTMGAWGTAAEPLMEGIFSLVAIVLLSWMLIWMTQQAGSMKKVLEGEISSVLAREHHTGWGVLSLIFVAVLREGFETVVFIAAKFQQGFLPAVGTLLGIGAATAVGMLLNALFGYTDRLYQVQAVAYWMFLVTIGSLYFRSLLRRPAVGEAAARAAAGHLIDPKDLSRLDQSR